MSFELREIDADADFPALTRCMLEAYEDPRVSFFQAWMPIHAPGPEAREAALDELAQRLRLWHSQDPTNYWQKVIETKTGRVAGVGAWYIYPTNPFAEPDDVEVSWFPDDSSRTYAEKWLEAHGTPRFRAAQKPHLYLFNVVTHPDFRRQGVGQMFMDWGMSKADELGLDFFLESTAVGKPLYDRNGFVVLEDFHIAPTTQSPDEKWKQAEQQIGSYTFHLMWRPPGGGSQEKAG